MATKTNTFEGGADSTNVTVGNSGGSSGDAFSDVIVNGASVAGSGDDTFQYRTAAAIGGSMGCRYTGANSPGTGTNHLRTVPTNLSAARTVTRFEFTYPGNPTADTDIIIMRNATANQATVTVHVNGQVSFRNVITYYAASRSTATLTPGSKYAIELAVTSETGGGGNGVIEYIVYELAGGTTFHTHTLSTAALGSTPTAQVRWVNAVNTNGWATLDFDNPRVADLASGWIGGIANVAPTVSAGANQNVAAGATVNLTATASDSDGTISSYAWTWDWHPTNTAGSNTGITGANASAATITAGSAGFVGIPKVTVTDNSGGTASATVEIRVPDIGSVSNRPTLRDGTGTGTWTKAGGSATDGAALADETDTTYIESTAVSGVELNRRIRLKPTAAKATASMKHRLWTDSGTANGTMRLYEGTTLRQSWNIATQASPAQALTTTPTEYTFALSSPTIAAIGDWSNLYCELGVTS